MTLNVPICVTGSGRRGNGRAKGKEKRRDIITIPQQSESKIWVSHHLFTAKPGIYLVYTPLIGWLYAYTKGAVGVRVEVNNASNTETWKEEL